MNVDDYQVKARTTAIYPDGLAISTRIRKENAWEADSALEVCITSVRLSNGKDLDVDEQYVKMPIIALCYSVLGLTNEAGEVAGKLKKIIRDNKGLLTEKNVEGMSKEIGDNQWYAADTATNLNKKMSEILGENNEKLADRAARGVLQGNGDNR